jgi:uncharacterized protein (DUF1330 family)
MHRVAIIEFSTLEQARRFYDSAEYAPLRAIREAVTESELALVDGVS